MAAMSASLSVVNAGQCDANEQHAPHARQGSASLSGIGSRVGHRGCERNAIEPQQSFRGSAVRTTPGMT